VHKQDPTPFDGGAIYLRRFFINRRRSALLPIVADDLRQNSPQIADVLQHRAARDALRELFWRALPARFAQLIVGSKLCTVSDRLGAGDVNRRARHPYSRPDGAHSAKASLGRRVGTICSSFGSQRLHLGSI
jgi:hypothetical protein